MRAIDSVLSILVQQEGTELWLVSDTRPRMFKEDAELPLTIPPMTTERIRYLLDDLWTAHESELRERGRVSVAYRSEELGDFAVRLVQPDGGGIEACFRRGAPQRRVETAAAVRHADPEPAALEIGAAGGELPAALVNVLARAFARGASDVHLSASQAPIARINGGLESIEAPAGFDAGALVGTQARLEQLRGGLSVDRAVDVPGVGRMRVNVYTAEEGVCAAVRILRREAPTLADLNLPPQVERLVDLPHGLVIVCGPTGSGKSTTLAALVQHALRARAQVLVTLEDPIEYVIRPMRPGGLVRQREVGTHVRDFATGLRDALREDPDLLLVGEMRDPETINLALTAAETGHLVFATLHSRTAASAVERIVDTYPPERQRQIRVQIADALRAVISQRLVPSADGTIRLPAVEVLRVTPGVANLIREGRTPQIINALQAGGDDGMLVLERSLAELVRARRVRRETAIESANDAATMTDYLRGAG